MKKIKKISFYCLCIGLLIGFLCCEAWPDWLLWTFGALVYVGMIVFVVFAFRWIIKEIGNRVNK